MTEQQKIIKKYIGPKECSLNEFLEFIKNKNERYELINGKVYMMASPNVTHQNIAGAIYRKLGNYLEGKPCKPFIAPLDVVLSKSLIKDKKDKKKSDSVVQPDVFVVCDSDKISKERINGTPDLVFEIVSPSSETHDYFKKFSLYTEHGVREYWIVNPETKQIFVKIDSNEETEKYSFEDKIKISIFDDFYIDFKELFSGII